MIFFLSIYFNLILHFNHLHIHSPNCRNYTVNPTVSQSASQSHVFRFLFKNSSLYFSSFLNICGVERTIYYSLTCSFIYTCQSAPAARQTVSHSHLFCLPLQSPSFLCHVYGLKILSFFFSLPIFLSFPFLGRHVHGQRMLLLRF